MPVSPEVLHYVATSPDSTSLGEEIELKFHQKLSLLVQFCSAAQWERLEVVVNEGL